MSDQHDDVIDDRKKYDVHEGIVFAIELTDTLLTPRDTVNKSNLQTILEALQEAMAHSVITLPSTGYGCYFFNSAESTHGRKQGVQKIFSLKDLNHKDMKKIHEILEENVKPLFNDRPYIPLQQRFHPQKDRGSSLPLVELLTTLQDEFLLKKDFQKQYNIKKVFLFTDNDKPVDPHDTEKKERLRTICNDLDQSQVTVLPFFLNKNDTPFDDSIYSEIMKINVSNEDHDIFDGPSTRPIDVEDIKDRIIRRKEIKRIQFQCPLIFSNNLTIGLKGYAVYSHESVTKTKYVYDTPEFRKNVHTKTRYLNAATSADVDAIKRLYRVGSAEEDYIALTPEQEQQIHRYDEKYDTFLRLIGFKDEKSGVKMHYNSVRSPFVVPDEDSYTGSTRTLSALYQALKKKKKVAILFGKVRKSSQPNMYALQSTRRFQHGDVKANFPEGFFLIRLPFFDDIRQFPTGYDTMRLTPPMQLHLKTKMILRELNTRSLKAYSPQDFKNPTLQQHYRTLHDYLLQVEQDIKSFSARQLKIKNDDTLRQLEVVRNAINDSKRDPKKNGNLYQHMCDWNDLYEKL